MEEIKINEFWPWLVKSFFLWEFLKPSFLYFKFQRPHFLMFCLEPSLPKSTPFCTFLVQVLMTLYVCVKLYAFKMFSNNFWPSTQPVRCLRQLVYPQFHMWGSDAQVLSYVLKVAQLMSKDKARARTHSSCLCSVSFLCPIHHKSGLYSASHMELKTGYDGLTK